MKTVRDIKNAYDPDLFVKMVLADKGHQQRSVAKAARVAAEREAAVQQNTFEVAARWCTLSIVGSFILSVAAVLAMV